MVSFERFTLANGLKVLVHEDPTTPMAVVNILYDVGARDEHPDQTGFAHLFEHLMFGGSVNIPSYDEPLQRVGGENNAFTSNDITNYYITLPSVNLETAFWLESDRMLSLAFSEKSLEVQRNVVCEEFKQRYLNQPYGDVWLKLRPMAYKQHPYQWATIGKSLDHIENANIEDVKAFFARHYNPSNAIMVVGGDVKLEEVKRLSEKWFGNIPAGEKLARLLPMEDDQTEERKETVTANVPLNAIYKVFHMPSRTEPGYYAADLISDILSRGNSSRLFRNLLKDQKLFSDINAYLTGSLDAGLFVVEGKPLPGISMEVAEAAIWKELGRISKELVPEAELTKVKNKMESTMVFSEMSLLDKAMNLAYFELLGDADQLNSETQKYLDVSAEEIRTQAAHIFRKENSSTLYYLAK
ncbi:MAG: peptidase M16 [Sphingobacteriales bacterium 17-39-43]|uniref:M16 family metallopeptidase n=1 Tax=Daejeonella sp. TaxID=2805397 RepID=UPI000BDAD626|nr:pitrilysin family protein [Daejeonella sp.]OYY03933.1 MAG: peptidase M16 [Sphingobacteriia bacterium 35-40-5]OYZ29477.1 MAG: peptidase M16 [Sphingobacteriales bacterium 16-39-50]OYZ58504.1 MAG: peptidase M16 [Sphingobacteriales bacterium 24-40-4]OZA22607.1 MAG: peptidase M16 [Sphingobacteriales bacterium 17-39-43]OZA62149.1 MAG: peptidase M16 [Sphingobacteriales bacterium 39-40-5]